MLRLPAWHSISWLCELEEGQSGVWLLKTSLLTLNLQQSSTRFRAHLQASPPVHPLAATAQYQERCRCK
jgi:hypothetical protein